MGTNDLYGNDSVGRVITEKTNFKIFLEESDKSSSSLPRTQNSSGKLIKSKGGEYD